MFRFSLGQPLSKRPSTKAPSTRPNHDYPVKERAMLLEKNLTLTRRCFFQVLINGALLATGTASALHSTEAKLPMLPRARLPLAPPLETFVAGTIYYDAPEVRHLLAPGDRLRLVRQPSNPHDAAAIEVFTAGGKKLGYVPRADNPLACPH